MAEHCGGGDQVLGDGHECLTVVKQHSSRTQSRVPRQTSERGANLKRTVAMIVAACVFFASSSAFSDTITVEAWRIHDAESTAGTSIGSWQSIRPAEQTYGEEMGELSFNIPGDCGVSVNSSYGDIQNAVNNANSQMNPALRVLLGALNYSVSMNVSGGFVTFVPSYPGSASITGVYPTGGGSC